MTDIPKGSDEELAQLLVSIQQTLDSMASDVATIRKTLDHNGDIEHRLANIEQALEQR